MAAASLPFPEDVAALIERKDLEGLEDVWTRRMEETPEDLSFFFGVASAVKKKGAGDSAISWLRFLADYHAENGKLDARYAVLLEIARMSPTDPSIRSELEEAVRRRFAGHPALSAVLSQFTLASSTDPSETGNRIARWLRFTPGDLCLMPGHGAGRIVELNPALDVIRVDFGGSRLPFSIVSAEKNLQALPPGHFLRAKLEDPVSLRSLAEREPAEAVRRLLESFGGSLPMAQLKDHLGGIVEDARWTSFWMAARKHPQVLISGTGKQATVSWTETADAADAAVREAFLRAEPHQKLELARKNAKRSRTLAAFFAETLAQEARDSAASRPAVAWELSQAAARLAPGEPEAFPSDLLLAAGDPLALLREIRDHTARDKALDAIRERRPDWADLFAGHFGQEEDGRILEKLYEALGDVAPRREELTRRILRSPRQAPRAFLWLVERLPASARPPAPALFHSLLEALRQDEFSGLRARIKELFEPGGLAVSLVQSAASEAEAREMLSGLERAGNLEDHRRVVVKEALLMRFPQLRAPAREWIYGTAEAIAERRRELQQLSQVELPANAEAMRTAKEHGDLSENFEYHAARQRHEYLSARIATLADQLSRSRPLEPSEVDPSEVRVGTRVTMRDPASGGERTVTILGPWDSRPEAAVYSYESEFAQSLLGKAPGESVTLPDGNAVIVSVARWK
ncbi:MAG: GreA/GreB family elongation factor [Thermoanaerobaculia bacterium]